MPEDGVEFNEEVPIPPDEYLMRRSHNPRDSFIPGAIIREWKCPDCGEVTQRDDTAGMARLANELCRNHEGGHFPMLEIYSVDVPLVKSNGERWE